MSPASVSARATTPSGTRAPPTPPSNSYRDSTLALFSLLLAFRIVNALALCTFFQPDEYFQSLEPAWQLAFGESSNAWITWEWRTQLRSSLHPELFAVVYQIAAKLADVCGLSLSARAELLLVTPKVAQAVFAALLDCYTWKLACKVYGRDSRAAFATLALSICSPWQWFCSTRTLSNCLETTLTSIAIYHWPWHWHGNVKDVDSKDTGELLVADKPYVDSLKGLRLSLLLAALACVLRPTNALIWLSIGVPTLWRASHRMQYVCIREVLFCGSAVLACSATSDRFYYGVWTLPPVRFLYFNIAQSLAVFYGKNRPDYYFTEGLPLLLTTAVPFAVIGLWQALRRAVPREQLSVAKSSSNSPTPEHTSQQQLQQAILSQLAWTCLTMTTTLSLISHKEVRFLYPILPFLHILSARPLSNFLPSSAPPSRKLVISLLLTVNLLLAGYTSQVHQRGVIDVLTYLRHKHETHHNLSTLSNPHTPLPNTTIAFLMPCHSTPWRSHLIHPSLSAWALTCNPPLDIPLSARATYLDEADEFYLEPGPTAWLRANMQDVQTVAAASGSPSGQHWTRQDPKSSLPHARPWPQNLVFFAQLEEELGRYLRGSRYSECWRGFNSQWHDDWRRVGDVVVWCLDGGVG